MKSREQSRRLIQFSCYACGQTLCKTLLHAAVLCPKVSTLEFKKEEKGEIQIKRLKRKRYPLYRKTLPTMDLADVVKRVVVQMKENYQKRNRVNDR